MGDMWDGGRSILSARRLAAGLAVLAMFLQVVVPQGFMTAREGGWPAIVICTGHGPVLSRGDLPGHPAKAPKSKPDVVCAFAHGAGAAPPSTPTAAATKTRWTPDITTSQADLIPGRGLVAPPPPSQGPPTFIL
jgi:hypothetical protein